MNLADLILSEQRIDLREYTRQKQEEPNLGNLLFPSIKQSELTIGMIKGANKKSVTAQVYAPDSTTKLSGRDEISTIVLDMALVKDSKRLNERDLLYLANPRTQAERNETILKIFDDVTNTIDSVYRRINMMRFEVLQTGKLTLNENGVKGTIDYGMPANHQVTLATAKQWGKDGSTPLEDIFTWTDTIVADQGVLPTRAITDKGTLSLLLRDPAIKKAINGVNADKMLTRQELNAFLAQQDLPQLISYDEKYIDFNGKSVNLITPGNFILLPEGKLGNTYFGPTAEELELVGKSGIESTSRDFITSVIYRQEDPVGRITKSVARAIPTFEAGNEVFVAKVR